MEEWKDVVGYEGLYQVSENGNVRSIDHYASNGKVQILYKGREIKKCLNNNDYVIYRVVKRRNGKCFTGAFLAHRVAAQAFIPNPENKEDVNHIDGNKLNNHISNLEWNTRSENMVHAVKNRLLLRKITPEQKAEIKSLYVHNHPHFGLSALGRMYKVTPQSIFGIVKTKQ